MPLIIFYDAACPICRKEMASIKQHDNRNLIHPEDINAVDFNARYPQIDVMKANATIHGLTADGKLLVGLDVIITAWQLLEKRPWLRLLRLPLIKPVADFLYLQLAKHRFTLSYLLTGKKRCDTASCRIDD